MCIQQLWLPAQAPPKTGPMNIPLWIGLPEVLWQFMVAGEAETFTSVVE